eukprot:CAMPEP_0195283168 /NCGR_PEP_ID=MMETSP0707-20130614/1803_1 /TAXON_ID=33640 /ORGANISM="Asterionellopsis glacialis, Strain CCMP134" /LENGTH=160 /DNA_ID=CAMNT_0040342293 /DNA_START=1270 /DNA_END=1748 /DNA_ORIENTATION=-
MVSPISTAQEKSLLVIILTTKNTVNWNLVNTCKPTKKPTTQWRHEQLVPLPYVPPATHKVCITSSASLLNAALIDKNGPHYLCPMKSLIKFIDLLALTNPPQGFVFTDRNNIPLDNDDNGDDGDDDDDDDEDSDDDNNNDNDDDDDDDDDDDNDDDNDDD